MNQRNNMMMQRPALQGLVFLCLAGVMGWEGSVASVAAGPIDDLQPGHWYEVPNSHIRDVVPNPPPAGPNQGPPGIVNAWNGGGYDTKRDRFIVWGGGHSAYGGNELYVFDINTMQWSRAWGPSPPSAGFDPYDNPTSSCPTTYSDGNPVSRHNYDGQEYLPPPVDKWWFAGGSLYCTGGNSSSDAWWFDFDALTWTQRAGPPVSTFADLELVAAYDPVTQHLFFSFPNNPLSEYNPSTNTWTVRGDQGPGYGRSAAAVDPIRRKLVVIGGGQLYAYTITPSGIMNRQTLNTTGATSIINGRPGLEYDPVSDRLVAWNGGPTLYVLNLDTLVWTQVTPAPTNTVTPTAAASGGTYGRFRYVPSKNVFIAVNSIDQNVYVYKLSPGGGVVGGSSMPSLQDERDTYTRWGWTWTASKEPNFPSDASFTVNSPDIHDDTEGDDLWTYLMMYRRTGQTGYLHRAQAWADYFKNSYLNSTEFNYDQDNFDLDHLYGWGLVAWYDYNGDVAALTAAENILAEVEAAWANRTPGSYRVATWGLRMAARHLLLATRVAERTGSPRWITLRDKIINSFMQAPDWDARGMYFMGQEATDARVSAGAYAAGARVQASFHVGILSEALGHAYRVTGRTDLRDRLVAVARYVDQYGLDTVYQYTGNSYGIVNGVAWHNYRGSSPTTNFWDPNYTTSQVNALGRGYKFTGEQALLDKAKHVFNRGTKGIYGSPTARSSPDNVVDHFVDTKFDSSTGNFFLAYNKGELQYASLIFENGGLPTVEGPPPPPDGQAPSVPANLTATALSTSAIDLNWDAATDNVGVTGYRVYRDGGLVATLAGTGYSDAGLAAGTTYDYQVEAYDAAGNSSTRSPAEAATTQAAGGGGLPGISGGGGGCGGGFIRPESRNPPSAWQVTLNLSLLSLLLIPVIVRRLRRPHLIDFDLGDNARSGPS